MNKRDARRKRARRTREKIKQLGREKGVNRLVINRSSRHIRAQILAPKGGKVLAQASSLDKQFKEAMAKFSGEETGKVAIAKVVGQLIAERAKKNQVAQVACDRSGFQFHGRVAALVNEAREHGLQV